MPEMAWVLFCCLSFRNLQVSKNIDLFLDTRYTIISLKIEDYL